MRRDEIVELVRREAFLWPGQPPVLHLLARFVDETEESETTPMTELWRYQPNDSELASAVGIDGGRVRLEVGVPDGVIAEEPSYEIELGPEEAKALGQRLIRWADPMIGIRG